MKRLKSNLIVLCLLAVSISCQQKKENGSRVSHLPYYKDAYFTPHWNLSKKELASFHRIPNFNLVAQSGQPITEKTFENKIYVANFFFTTCPGICPKMTSNLAMVQQVFKSDDEVLLLSHSVTPKKDSVSVLNHYATVNHILPSKWFLATGDRTEIYNLGRKFYFAEEKIGLEQTKKDFLHTENFVLIDQNRHIRGIYNGLNKTAVYQLIADIKTLQKESYL